MTPHACDLVHAVGPLGIGRWICRAHDVEVDQRWPDAYSSNPTPDDFRCPIKETA